SDCERPEDAAERTRGYLIEGTFPEESEDTGVQIIVWIPRILTRLQASRRVTPIARRIRFRPIAQFQEKGPSRVSHPHPLRRGRLPNGSAAPRTAAFGLTAECSHARPRGYLCRGCRRGYRPPCEGREQHRNPARTAAER